MANIIEIDRVNNIIVIGTTGTVTRFPFLAANRMAYLNGDSDITSIADLTSWVGGTANQITSTDDDDGTITLSIPNSLAIPGKLTAGSFASPLDVTNTREYGVELHYSGNNYNATAIRARAHAVTTDTSAQFQGGLFQAANNDNINVGCLNGLVAEAIGKATTNVATITMMRGALVGAEWSAKDIVTDLRTLHIRTHTRDAATEGYISGTGYGLYIENEAVGGNGQALDAGIYFKGTSLSAGNKAFTYGIDFSGATYGTADIKLSDNSVINNSSGYTGLGTASPTRKFVVIENDTDAIFIRDNSGTDASTLSLGINTTTGFTYIQSRNDASGVIQPLTFWVGSTRKVTIATDGKFGIGTESPDTKLQVVGDCKFGDDNTNYTTLAADGILTMTGTARVMIDRNLDPDAVKKGAVGPGDGVEDNANYYFATHDYQATNDESIFRHFEIPHNYALAGVIHVHVEWFVDTAPASTEYVTWGLEYKKQVVGDNFDFSSSTTTIIVNDAITSGTPANDKKTHESGTLALTTTGFEPGDFILMRFFRDADASESGATDDYGSDVRVFNYHLEYLADKLGEAT